MSCLGGGWPGRACWPSAPTVIAVACACVRGAGTRELAPPQMGTRAQGMVTAVRAAGQLVGILSSGLVYERRGARTLFTGMALLAAPLGTRTRKRGAQCVNALAQEWVVCANALAQEWAVCCGRRRSTIPRICSDSPRNRLGSRFERGPAPPAPIPDGCGVHVVPRFRANTVPTQRHSQWARQGGRGRDTGEALTRS